VEALVRVSYSIVPGCQVRSSYIYGVVHLRASRADTGGDGPWWCPTLSPQLSFMAGEGHFRFESAEGAQSAPVWMAEKGRLLCVGQRAEGLWSLGASHGS